MKIYKKSKKSISELADEAVKIYKKQGEAAANKFLAQFDPETQISVLGIIAYKNGDLRAALEAASVKAQLLFGEELEAMQEAARNKMIGNFSAN